MKKMLIKLALFSSIGLSSLYGANVGNGWTGSTTITGMDSYFSGVHFEFNNVSNGCGTQGPYWILKLGEFYSRDKLALLTMAYASGKTVNVRCENSMITDFRIEN